jgi:general secretion pathway protein M
MKARWQQLNTREQRLVSIMAIAVLIFILYSAIWQPLNDNLVKANKKLIRQQALLTWVTESTTHYQQAKRHAKVNNESGSLSAIVNKSASSYELTITRMQPQGNDLQVWIDNVPFTKLLLWLEHLANTKGLQVQGIDVAHAERTGEVTVRRLQLTKN